MSRQAEAGGAPTRLRSKRNLVEKCCLPRGGWGVRKDFRENLAGYETELAVVRRLAEAGVPAAPILQAEPPVLLYRWLAGTPLADLLEAAEDAPADEARFREALPALRRWLAGFYAACPGTVLGDAHLRNFLLSPAGELAGVDFECCHPGAPEEDIARLTAFTLTYDPPLTPVKRRLAACLLAECSRGLGLRRELLADGLAKELAGICRRRGLGEEARVVYEAAGRDCLDALPAQDPVPRGLF